MVECCSCMTLVKERTQLDRAVLTLSSTLRHLSAPHKEATSFSLSSSWLRFCTHSLTVATQHTQGKSPFHILKATWKSTAVMFTLESRPTHIHTNVVTFCPPITTYVHCISYTYLCLQYGPNLPAAAVLLWTNPQLSWRLERAVSPWQDGQSTTEQTTCKISYPDSIFPNLHILLYSALALYFTGKLNVTQFNREIFQNIW